MRESESVRLEFARSAVENDAAQLLVERAAAVADDLGLARRHAARSARDAAHAASMSRQTVERLFVSTGTRTQRDGDVIQRAWRDVHAAASHAALRFDIHGSAYAQQEWSTKETPMNKPAETVHDVAVVGAGPVGMALACLLASSGVHPVVLERLTGPSGVTKVGSIGPQAVEALAKCGVYDDLADAERQTLLGYAAMAGGGRRTASGSGGGARQVRGEHFAGMGGIDSSAYVTDRRRRMLIEQPVIVSILLKRAAEHGVQPRWDHEVTGLTQHEDHVAVTVTAGGAERTVRARYVIGADGPHSTVRKLAGFEFPAHPAP